MSRLPSEDQDWTPPRASESSKDRKCCETGERPIKQASRRIPAQSRKSQVFFTRDISVNGLLNIYSKINGGMTGKIGIKLHSGEPHGPNLLPIELIRGLQPHVANGTIVECNVLYPSPRQNTATHRDPYFSNITFADNSNYSEYNGLALSLRKE